MLVSFRKSRRDMPALQLFSAPPEDVRSEQKLDNHMPKGFETFDVLDQECARLASGGVLTIVSSGNIQKTMGDVKNPDLPFQQFGSMARYLLSTLTKEAAAATNGEPRKVALSVRAAVALQEHTRRYLPEAHTGFSTQRRNQDEEAKCVSNGDKLGPFVDKDSNALHGVLFDPMLATGGSMTDLINDVMDRGASGVTVVTAFSAPQGIVKVSQHDAVRRMISLPLEAGLTEGEPYIVGGHKPHSMLGDFGDRYFGPVE